MPSRRLLSGIFSLVLFAAPNAALAEDTSSTISVTVQAAGGGGGSSGGGGGEGQSLRPISLLLKIAENTFVPPGLSETEPLPPPEVSETPEPVEETEPTLVFGHLEFPSTITPAFPEKKSEEQSLGRPEDDVAGILWYEQCTLFAPACLGRAAREDILHGAATVLPTFMIEVIESAPFLEVLLWVLLFTLIAICLRILWQFFLSGLRFVHWTINMFKSHGIHNGWHALNLLVLGFLSIYGTAAFLEWTGAASSDMGIQFFVSNTSVSCTSSLNLGTITVTGDTGGYTSSKAVTCLVSTSDPDGYTLSWQVRTGSGGTSTGRLISTLEDVIEPYAPAVSGTPETWTIPASTSAWGGRLSSDSTIVNTATWGTDGATEKWLNVGTGSYVVAQTSSQTSGTDTEKIGFRAQIGASKEQPIGTYSTSVTFTVTPR